MVTFSGKQLILPQGHLAMFDTESICSPDHWAYTTFPFNCAIDESNHYKNVKLCS